MIDELAIGLVSVVPLRCDLLAVRALVAELHGTPADDSLGVEDESKAVGVGLVAQMDEQVVLHHHHTLESGEAGSVGNLNGGTPAALVDAVVGFVVAGLGGASYV